ncbi:MAG: hypothetical protein K0B00_03970 [Rhodobacteraceae bacterium]|nr:hypothetical protein [Paracoccaceae bacterium]
MSAADDAYAEAERLIAEAKRTGAKDLSFNRPETHALTRLPPGIAALDSLRELDLSGTQVTDLAPMAGMTGIATLWLKASAALDLRPLRGLRALVETPEHRGLTFKGSAAARADSRIAEIAKITDPATRARTLFDYLETWVPPLPPEAPEPDPFLPVVIKAGRLEVAASLPDAAERDEPLKRALHARLRPKVEELAQAAGNRFPRLARLARALLADVDKPLEDVDLLQVHLGVEDLTQRLALGQEDGEMFPPEVTGPLSDVVRIAPGLTLDHADVMLFEDRKRRYRQDPAPAEDQAAHAALGRALAAGDPAIGDRLQALEQRIEGLSQSVLSAIQTPVHRNLVWRIAAGATLETTRFGVAVVAGVAASNPAISAFVHTHWALLVDVAGTYGAGFLDWFIAAVAPTPELRARLPQVNLTRFRDP